MPLETAKRARQSPSPTVYTCDACGQHYKKLSQHFVQHPTCRLQILGSDDEDTHEEVTPLKPPSSLAAACAEGVRRDWVSNDLCDLRYEHGLDGPAIACVKTASRRWLDLAARAVMPQLKPLLRDGVSGETALATLLAFDLFADLENPKKEAAYMRQNLPYLEPRVVSLEKDGDVVSFDVGDLLVRKLQNDPNFRKRCIAKSDEWKLGEHWQEAPSGDMKDMDDAVAARYHPHLMRKATASESHDLRFALIKNADDVEVCNPLGTARGEHKECGVQAAIVNLPTSERFAEHNILLLALAKNKLYKKHGMARVIAGVDAQGVQHDEANNADDMRKLDRGRWIQIPDDSGEEPFLMVRLRVWDIVFSGDYLGAQSMLPMSECAQACRPAP